MGQVTPNGTYTGTVVGGGGNNAIVLNISSADPDTSNIGTAFISYGGTNFKVTGSFDYQTRDDAGPVSFHLRAEAEGQQDPVYAIELNSPDRDYNQLTGTLKVSRGAGAGQQYSISLSKAPWGN